LVKFCKSENIVPVGYIPVCRPGDVRTEVIWADESLGEICTKYGKSRAQVMLNWAVRRGTVPIPRSGSLGHQIENISIFDFKLTEDEMQVVNSLNKDFRICGARAHTNHFNIFA